MKKIFGTLFISLLLLCSCSTTNEEDGRLLKKIVEIKIDGTSVTTFFTYNGNEIVSIDEDKKHTDFTYTGDLITKAVVLNKTNQVRTTVEYTYADGKLVCAKSPNKYKINYVHNADGTIFYEKLTIDPGVAEVELYHGILYFQSGNFIKDERIVKDADVSVLSKYSVSYKYDSKNNPLNEILGYSKLLDRNESISLNNSIKKVIISSITKDDQISSVASLFESSFKYDAKGYPTEQVSETAVASTGDLIYLKSVYFYE
jgi:hypothetical protein